MSADTEGMMIAHLVGGPDHGTDVLCEFTSDKMPQPWVDVKGYLLPLGSGPLPWFLSRPPSSASEVRYRYTLDVSCSHFGDDFTEHHVYRFAGKSPEDDS